MFGTLTLKGVQEKNIFVDEHGNSYRLINSWICPNIQMKRYVQIRKYNDDYWFLMRTLNIGVDDE